MLMLIEDDHQEKEQFSRIGMMLGEEGIKRLRQSRVAVLGLGGVGGHAAEALARSGVGALDLVDKDVVEISNLNRQLVATYETIGRKKTAVMAERLATIVPSCRVRTFPRFYLPGEADWFDFTAYDYIVDAIDTVTAKIDLAVQAERRSVPIISCMGAGNKLDPTALKVADIYETSVCPLAKVMRKELKERGVKHLRVVYSVEPALKTGSRTPGSNAFVPAAAGLIMAAEVVKGLACKKAPG